ncbi:hypothetical protein RchiOBHm_Chr1g0337241 [Rosa chinensis]|uniref:Uncharacterized protein n=1 Tax=Rosa chinensis TaxID=74649 RepID=A0A2P6SCV9_ROSCH|nr:hypothetical protein RchiOBHm_Chr1g0337241 [Rosa chinensis]
MFDGIPVKYSSWSREMELSKGLGIYALVLTAITQSILMLMSLSASAPRWCQDQTSQ